jgi:regulator of PEP synthase PpsR (kinase-PPPase family)
LGITQQILFNNKYGPSTIEDIKNRKNHQKRDREGIKWAKFTYISRETRFITKIFKKSNIIIAITTNNTIGKFSQTE